MSLDPAQWPAASRPYFMLAVDTSGSMIGCTNPSTATYQLPNSCPSTAPKNSCNFEPTRLNDAKCALRKTVQAFCGEVNFGLLDVRRAPELGLHGGACADSCTAANGTLRPAQRRSNAQGEFYCRQRLPVSRVPNASHRRPAAIPPDCGGNPEPPRRRTSPKAPGATAATSSLPMLQDPTWGPTRRTATCRSS